MMFPNFDKVAALQCTAQGLIYADFDVGISISGTSKSQTTKKSLKPNLNSII